MNRRDFLKLTALTSLSVAAGFDTFTGAAFGAAPAYDLAVASGPSPSRITAAAIDALGGMKSFIQRGDIVVVKPNIGWDRTPEYAANTNPEVVSTIVRLCLEAGAKKVKVFDRPVNDPRRCYVQSGISDAVKAAGGELSFIDERKFRDVKINGSVLKSWPLYAELIEADKVINVPIAKHHGLSKLTLGMKNWMGVMGGSRASIHQKLDESLVDLSMAIKPTLVVVDAVRILTANGPQGGNLKDVKKLDTVVAGVNQVAVDAYAATLFGMKSSDLGYVRIASQKGFGPMDTAKMKIKKVTI
ncbi:MAG: cytoplasmic protein [Nitrospirae bacterium]|nr:MAG: cytoplasmic protein [Nitrospirota bacterium]